MKFQDLDCILLVDDDKPVNFLHQFIIEKSDIEVHVKPLQSGVDALDFLTRKGRYADNTEPLPGIIFLDINMPGMDGFEFVEEYKSLTLDFMDKSVIVMLTTSQNPIDKLRAENTGEVVALINKPLTVEKLKQIAHEYYT